MHSPVCVGKRALNSQAVLCRVFAYSHAVEVALKGRRFINVYRSSQENLMDKMQNSPAAMPSSTHSFAKYIRE